MWGDPVKSMRLANQGAVAECAMNITPQDCWAAADEIDRLRAVVKRLQADRPYVVGFKDGFEEAMAK